MNIPKEEKKVKYFQKDKIFNHLDRFGSITQKEAFELYAITRLGARIYELREAGLVIDMIYETGVNRFGEKTRYGRYFLRKDA